MTFGGILGRGWLPGLCQTSYRAELFALAFVLHHAAAGGFSVKVFSDCLGVVNRFHHLTTGRATLKLNSASADLWRWVLHSVDTLGEMNIQVIKTAAHKSISQATHRREAWQFWNNEVVDKVAKCMNLERPSSFWELWTRHSQNVQAAQCLHAQVVKLHVEVAKRSVKAAEDATLDDLPIAAPKAARVFPMCFEVAHWQGDVPLTFANEYGPGLAHKLARWWTARTRSDSAGQVRWITFVHLYTDWQLSFGCPGPWEDRIGVFHPGTINFCELCHRLQWQWNYRVAAAVSHRKDFGGLESVDPASTRATLSRLNTEEQNLLRLSLAGGLFTQDAHSHWNETEGLCKWCGQKDSLQHRYFECENTNDLRCKHASLVTNLRGLLPDAMVLCSWAIQPPTHLAWLRLLAGVSVSVPPLGVSFRRNAWSEVFTDGSCHSQAQPGYRFAAWGAILANPCGAT